MTDTNTGAFEPVTYVKGDDERVAKSPSMAVALAFEGFKPKDAQPAQAPDSTPAPTAPTATVNSAPPAPVTRTPAPEETSKP